MRDAGAASLIAIDWGTTSARAYRLDASGRVIGERAAPLGVQQVRDGAFAGALATILGDWAIDSAPRVACGMIGSRQGWREAPYCQCPVPFDSLSSALTHVTDGTLAIVPGVTCRDAAGVPDVMRGEETQIIGTVAGGDVVDSSRALVVLPGTHSKWAIVTGSGLETFATFMTGEMYAVLKAHSILGRMMTGEDAAQAGIAAPFQRGVLRGLDRGAAGASLLHDLFGARTLALFGELAPAEAADYLSGLLIGSELRNGWSWAAKHGSAVAPVVLVGAHALVERYLAAFAYAGIAARAGPDTAAARGLWHIARQAGLVSVRQPMEG